MKCYHLYRKLNIEGKNYYQLYDVSFDEKSVDNIANIENISNFNELDCFYGVDNYDDGKDISYFEKVKYVSIFDEKFKMISKNDVRFTRVIKSFGRKFNDFDYNEYIKEFSKLQYPFLSCSIDDITNLVFHQDEAIKNLLDCLKYNFEVLDNFSSIEKNDLKKNILFIGPKGVGKSKIIDVLKDKLLVPAVDISLISDNSMNIELIVNGLMKSAEKLECKDFSKSIVFVHDNFLETCQDNNNLFENLKNVMNSVAKINATETILDFSKLIFVVVSNRNIKNDKMIIATEMAYTNCSLVVLANELSSENKKDILLNCKDSHLNILRKLFLKTNRVLNIDYGAIDNLVFGTTLLGEGMLPINAFFDQILLNSYVNDKKSISITNHDVLNYVKECFENILEDNNKLISNNNQMDYSVNDIVSEMKKNICSQDEHLRRIVYNVLRNQKQAYRLDLDNPKRYIKNILIRGESGSGKTLIIQELTRLLGIPMYIADATKYTESGFVGNDVLDMLVSLYRMADGDLEKAERGVLVIDEIDKKAGFGGETDVSRGAVLDSLLKIVEGTVMPITIGKGLNEKEIMFDTSRLTVIASGAFEGIEKVRDSRTTVKKSIGFGNKDITITQSDNNITVDDYVEYGMERQFMARFGIIVNLNKLGIDDFKKIMKESNLSELNIQKELYGSDGIKFTYEESFYDELSKKAYDKHAGARGIDQVFQELLFNTGVDTIDPSKYSEVIFNGDCVNNNETIILVERKSKRKRKVK